MSDKKRIRFARVELKLATSDEWILPDNWDSMNDVEKAKWKREQLAGVELDRFDVDSMYISSFAEDCDHEV